MCLRKRKILNQKHEINKESFPQMIQYVRCGKCEECKKEIKNEWFARLYYENKFRLSHGYKIVFDTLTYSEENVPHFSEIVKDLGIEIGKEFDCYTFRRRDLTLFLKRLRKKYDSNTIRYFITAEYGSKEKYSHRPHYHCLFYLKNDVDVVKFVHDVATSWKQGITDCYHNGIYYTLTKRLIVDTELSVKASNYVSKYITKNSYYEDTINKRFTKMISLMKESDYMKYMNNYDGKIYIQNIRKNFNQYHVQSIGFGENYLDNVNIDDLIKNPIMTISGNNFGMKIKLPMYYYRKLFQKYDYVIDGTKPKYKKGLYIGEVPNKKIRWKDNENGILYKKVQLTERTYKNNYDWFLKDYLNLDKDSKNQVDNIVDSIDNYIYYITYIQNRLISNQGLPKPVAIVGKIGVYDNLVEFYNTTKDSFVYNQRFVNDNGNKIEISKYLKNNMANDLIDEKYKDYDKVEEIILKWRKKEDKGITRMAYDVDRLKHIFSVND